MDCTSKRAGGPPAIPWRQIRCTAGFDYLKLHATPKALPKLRPTHRWTKEGRDRYLTVQDPERQEVEYLIRELADPVINEIEFRVDLKPMHLIPATERESVLQVTYDAIAGRFRPQEATRWGHGLLATVSQRGMPPVAIKGRLPHSDEQIISGHRGDFGQSKAYWKRVNEGRPLSIEDQVIRLELRIRGSGLRDYGIFRMSDLLGYQYRSKFAKNFRIVQRAEIRAASRIPSDRREHLQKLVDAAWCTEGSWGFAVHPDLPIETGTTAARHIRKRARSQIAWSQAKLIRDQTSNAKIGTALRQLERRLSAKKSGGRHSSALT